MIIPIKSMESGVVIAPRFLKVAAKKSGKGTPRNIKAVASVKAVRGGEKIFLTVAQLKPGLTKFFPSELIQYTPSVQNRTALAKKNSKTDGTPALPKSAKFTGSPTKIALETKNMDRKRPRRPVGNFNILAVICPMQYVSTIAINGISVPGRIASSWSCVKVVIRFQVI